jgi:D-beta-D-heptose 7-phosphate kinase/D-beta-D-heptose 1-phosphate adenosyltransferase
MDIQQQKLFKTLVIGDACIDKYHYGHCERLSLEAPVVILRHSHSEEREGMCLNVVNNLRAFDQYAAVDKIYNKELIYKERFVDLKTRQHLLRFDVGESGLLTPLSEASIKKLKIETYATVIISDYNKGFITTEAGGLIAHICEENGIPLFVDSKKEDLSCFKNAIIKINEDEFKKVTEYPANYELIVTMGASGARWRDEVYKTRKCEVFDVSGAGDTFLAALVVEYSKTQSLPKAIKFANKCARIVVQKFGTYALKSEDLK